MATQIRIGDKVRWSDIALHEYTPKDREAQQGRIYEVYEIRDEYALIGDEYGEVECFPDELVLVQKGEEL